MKVWIETQKMKDVKDKEHFLLQKNIHRIYLSKVKTPKYRYTGGR